MVSASTPNAVWLETRKWALYRAISDLDKAARREPEEWAYQYALCTFCARENPPRLRGALSAAERMLGAGGARIGEPGTPKDAKPEDRTGFCVVDNNIIQDSGRIFPGSIGVWIGDGAPEGFPSATADQIAPVYWELHSARDAAEHLFTA